MADPLGVSVAFDADPMVPDPTWTRLDTLDGCRVRGWQIDRGRPDQFSKTDTGTATVRIVDRAGLFDNGSDTPYAGKVIPGKQAAIALRNPVTDEWFTLFRGFVESWSYQLHPTEQAVEVEMQLVDGFAVLSRWELEVGVAGVVPLPDNVDAGNVFYDADIGSVGTDRILDVIGDTDWPAELVDVFSGNVRCGPKVYSSGTTALEALFDAADAEFPGVANLYMSKDGKLTFRGRQARFHPDVAEYGIGRRTVADPSFLGDDPLNVPVHELAWTISNDNIFNFSKATPEWVYDTGWAAYRHYDPALDAAPYSFNNDSIATYGRRTITFDNLQTVQGIADSTNSLTETLKYATYYVANFKDPAARIQQMVFKTRRPGTPHAAPLWNHFCRCELSDLLTLKTTHPGGGGFDDDYYVEGIHYQAQPGGGDYPVVTLSLDVSSRAHYLVNPFDTDTLPE